MKRLILAALTATVLTASAQQTLFESNLLTKAVEQPVPEFTDGDDSTVGTVTGEDMTLVYRFNRPINVTGINIIAGDNLDFAPARVDVYGRNGSDESWKSVAKLMTVRFSHPFTNFSGRGYNAGFFSEIKVEIVSVSNGGKAAKLAELQLVGQDSGIEYSPTVILPRKVYYTGVMGDNTLESIRQIDYEEPVAITGYTLGAGSVSNKERRPAAWELQASTDGFDWVTLDMQANASGFDCENFAIEYPLGSSGIKIDFAKAADDMYKMIDEKFYYDYYGGKYLVHSWNPVPGAVNGGYNYWWMAHAVDAYVDAYARTGLSTFENHAREIRSGMYVAYDAGRRDLWNSFYDDMEWMCLACLRASETLSISPNEWMAEAKQLFDWIWQGWDSSTGGILWNIGSQRGTLDSKNSCSNAPAMLAAAILYRKTGEAHYLQKAKMIYDFMVKHNLFSDGFVKDSPSQDNRGWTFTYNQGTWVGGLMELYKATDDQKYYDTAVDLLDKSINSRWYSPNGIMCENGDGDGGLFKGIYIRYITEWVLSGLLDSEREVRYANYLLENARSLYLGALMKPEMTVMANWQNREDAWKQDYHSSVALSGLFLLESVDRLRRAGILNEDYSVCNPNHGKEFSHYRLRVTENFGGTTTEIASFSLMGTSAAGIEITDGDNFLLDDAWYTLEGIRLEQPSSPGIYIHNRKKVIIR